MRRSELLICDMSTELKVIGGGLALLGLSYGITYHRAYSVLSRCKFAISKVFVDNIDRTGFVLGIKVKVTNPTGKELRIDNNNKLKFYINTAPVAYVTVPYEQFIRPEDTTEILFAVVGYWADVNGWWNYLIKLSQTADFKVAGKLRVNGLSVPVPPITIYQYNITDIVNKIKDYA